jgi:DNA replication protein DnaC
VKKYAPEFERKYQELETLAFVEGKENIVLIGTPGAGKTRYATAIGIAACLKGKSALFASVPNLIIERKEAMTNQSPSTAESLRTSTSSSLTTSDTSASIRPAANSSLISPHPATTKVPS